MTYLLPVVIPRRLRAEISRVVDVLEFSEDVHAGQYIHGDVHKSQLNTEPPSTQHIQYKISGFCGGQEVPRAHVAGIFYPKHNEAEGLGK